MTTEVTVRVIDEMVGKTYTTVSGAVGDDCMLFRDSDGNGYGFFHESDCCESVDIADICGDLSDLVDYPILTAEAIDNFDAPAPENADSYTWTFYRFATAKGTVTVRWLGESNGYYGESPAERSI